jgi:hypothetical protein
MVIGGGSVFELAVAPVASSGRRCDMERRQGVGHGKKRRAMRRQRGLTECVKQDRTRSGTAGSSTSNLNNSTIQIKSPPAVVTEPARSVHKEAPL